MKNTLKQRTIKSGVWTLSGYAFSQLIRLGGNLILTRLLVPEMFGLMAIVTIFIMGISMLSDVGLLQNVVQSHRGDDREYLNTVWTIQIIQGGIIFLIAVAVSVILYQLNQQNLLGADTVYSDSRLPLLITAMSATSVINGFNSTGMLTLVRKLNMSKVIFIELTSQALGLTFMIVIAFIYKNVWALVLGSIASSFVQLLLSHYLPIGRRNYIGWNKKYAHEIFHFGKWIFASSILGFLLYQGDRILLGLWLSKDMLGIYSIAFFLAMALKNGLIKIISTVFYPMLSEIERKEPAKLSDTYYKIRSKVDFITMGASGIMVSSGHLVVDFLYDARYEQAGWMLQLLSLSMIFIGYSMANVCLLAKGDSKSNTVLILIALSFLYVSMPVAYHFYGLPGAVVAVSMNYIIDIPSTFYMMKKYQLLNIKKEFRMVPVFFLTYMCGMLLQDLIGKGYGF